MCGAAVKHEAQKVGGSGSGGQGRIRGGAQAAGVGPQGGGCGAYLQNPRPMILLTIAPPLELLVVAAEIPPDPPEVGRNEIARELNFYLRYCFRRALPTP